MAEPMGFLEPNLMRKVSIPKVSLNYIFLSPFREHGKQTLPKFKGKFADNSTANGWWYKANSSNGPKIALAAHVDEETKNFELYELSETPFFNNNADLENIAATGNYGNVADMRNMFLRCSKLTSLDLSNFDTSSVTNMSYMFSYCSKLTSLDVSNFNTSSVTDMTSMFDSCSGLTSLDLSNFDTSSLLSTFWTFGYCSGMTTLNLSGWNFSSLQENTNMFTFCLFLSTVIGPVTGIRLSLDLSDCPLTNESAMVFINGLENVSSTQTLKFSPYTYETLTQEQIAIATSKGWTIVESSSSGGGVN